LLQPIYSAQPQVTLCFNKTTKNSSQNWINLMKINHFVFISANLFSANAISAHCDVNFNYGVVIDPSHLRIIKHGQTLVQINGESQLFINGRELSLTKPQQQILSQYSQGIRTQVPEIVAIAIEGIDLGLKAVNKIIGSLTGENSAAHQKIQEKFNELQNRLRLRFNQSDQNFYIAPQDFDDFDEIIAGDLEQEIQEIVSNSIGTILSAVGDAMTTSNEDDLEHRVETMTERIEKIGENLEIAIDKPADKLNAKTAKFCQNLIQLDHSESLMQQSIPELIPYDLIRATAKSNK
jgi:DUF2884 family protein